MSEDPDLQKFLGKVERPKLSHLLLINLYRKSDNFGFTSISENELKNYAEKLLVELQTKYFIKLFDEFF